MALLTAPINTGQIAFLIAFIWSLLAWLLAELQNWLRPCPAPQHPDRRDLDPESAKQLEPQDPQQPHQLSHPALPSSTAASCSAGGNSHTYNTSTAHGYSTGSINVHASSPALADGIILTSKASGAAPGILSGAGAAGSAVSHDTLHNVLDSVAQSGLVCCLLLKRRALIQHRLVLRAVVEFGCLMIWYFLADRTTIFQDGSKSYSRDLFLMLFLMLTCTAVGSSCQALRPPPVLLSRPQSEEWKGWMQVLFLLYHYYDAKEAYNAIRIFIAAYVWMTGFGNFSYYYKTGDYCIGRFAQMLWRLNFLVFFACVVLRNSYMLYYICPMHTVFTVLVYVVLAVAPRLNRSRPWMLAKLVLAMALVYATWDVKRVFYTLWSPLTWLVGYSDPRKPSEDLLHEWYFRSSLDRYIWVYGMFCAWIHPQAAAFLNFIDELPALSRFRLRSVVIATCGAAGYWYYVAIYTLPKYEYNAVHPYTSWIPITLWIVLRNMTPGLRLRHLRLYGWLGCITLETYISQFHIWMKTGLPEGQPKSLLVLLPSYPLLNFGLVSALYVLVSYRLFELTNALKNVAVPHSNDAMLLRNVVMMVVTGAALYGVSWMSYSYILKFS